jgi:hypothetical protein
MIDTSPDSRDLPLVNEIFLIDPQTNQVHSVIRQIIPSGDKNVGELAMQQLKHHLENGDRQGHRTSKNSEDLSDVSYEKEEVKCPQIPFTVLIKFLYSKRTPHMGHLTKVIRSR